MEASALSPAGLSRISVAGSLLRLRSDEQLVALFRAGDDAAFDVIHDRYRARLLAYARQMLGGSRQDAEDTLQDVLLRAYHALRADDRPISLRAWLYRVAHNRCVDQLRRPVPAPVELAEEAGGAAPDPLAEAERRDDLRRLVQDIRRLPEQQRSALLMRELDGMSYAELAAALEVTVPAIKSLLVRARIGLVEAVEARDTACAEIREELAGCHDRGARATALARRHLRDCAGCRTWRVALRGSSTQLGALVPAGPGPLAALVQLLGIGGAGGAAAGAGGAGGALVAGSGGLAAGGTLAGASVGAKLTAIVAGVALTAGGANEVRKRVLEPVGAGGTAAATQPAPAAAGGAADLAVDRARAAAASAVGASARRPATTERAGAPAAARDPAAGPLTEEPMSPHVAPELPRVDGDRLTGGATAPRLTGPALPAAAGTIPGAADSPVASSSPLAGLVPAPAQTAPASEEPAQAANDEELSADPQAGTGGARAPASAG